MRSTERKAEYEGGKPPTRKGICVMTSVQLQQQAGNPTATGTDNPPYSRALRITAGVSLLLAGILNGLPPYLTHLIHGDLEFTEYIRWGTAHRGAVLAEQLALVTSMLFAPLGLLGLAHVTRWRSPRLTAIATPLFIWGMWGFQNLLSQGYLMVYSMPNILGVDQAVQFSESLRSDVGVIASGLVPHILGSFVGLILLTIACWKSRAFPRTPLVLLVAFLVWDYGLPSGEGVFEPHLLLVLAWGWLGLHLMRMKDATWRGEA